MACCCFAVDIYNIHPLKVNEQTNWHEREHCCDDQVSFIVPLFRTFSVHVFSFMLKYIWVVMFVGEEFMIANSSVIVRKHHQHVHNIGTNLSGLLQE
jgi:hypothetical protein